MRSPEPEVGPGLAEGTAGPAATVDGPAAEGSTATIEVDWAEDVNWFMVAFLGIGVVSTALRAAVDPRGSLPWAWALTSGALLIGVAVLISLPLIHSGRLSRSEWWHWLTLGVLTVIAVALAVRGLSSPDPSLPAFVVLAPGLLFASVCWHAARAVVRRRRRRTAAKTPN